jgi:hypothetical protein
LFLPVDGAADWFLLCCRPFRQASWQGSRGLFTVDSVVCKTCGKPGLPIACLFFQIKQVVVQQRASCGASWQRFERSLLLGLVWPVRLSRVIGSVY